MIPSLGWAVSRLLVAFATGVLRTPSPVSPVETSEPQLVIRIYDSTAASPKTVAIAGEEAVRILRHAGLDATWLDCSDYRLEHAPEPACARPVGPAEVILRILPHPEARSRFADETSGFSMLPDDGGPGVFAGVFRDRVRRIPRTTDAWGFRIIGLLAAHEIGHLLLGSNSHSGTGIMRSGLFEKSLEDTAWGHLCFSPSEAERMRAELRSRVEITNRR